MKTSEIKSRHLFFFILFLLFIGYALFQARTLIAGPVVSIENPKDGQTINASIMVIVGTARNAAWLTLNDRQIFTDEEGNWSEKLILSKGVSIMTIRARDRFGRETEESIRVFLSRNTATN